MPQKNGLVRKAKKVLGFYQHNYHIEPPYKILGKHHVLTV
jgi:hypothetical protein